MVVFDADEKFLEAFGGLHDGFESPGLTSLDTDGAGAVGASEGFSAVGPPDDGAGYPVEPLDFSQGDGAFLGGTLVASARGHGL